MVVGGRKHEKVHHRLLRLVSYTAQVKIHRSHTFTTVNNTSTAACKKFLRMDQANFIIHLWLCGTLQLNYWGPDWWMGTLAKYWGPRPHHRVSTNLTEQISRRFQEGFPEKSRRHLHYFVRLRNEPNLLLRCSLAKYRTKTWYALYTTWGLSKDKIGRPVST